MAAIAPHDQPRRVMRPREPRLRRRGPHDDRREREQPPRLAESIELLGEFEDSGFEEAPHLARRADGQTIQLTRLLHLVAEAADGRRSYAQMAEVVAERLGRGVSADNVRFLVEKKLRPLGVLAASDGTSPRIEKADPLLALRFRTALVPERVTRALTTIFRPLFLPTVVGVVFAAFAAAVGWLFFVHGVGQGLRALIYDPVYLLVLFGGIVLGTAFHEIGHATALRYGGGRPGVMGAGIYIVWPAFYTDVTDAYRLNRAGRLRTDLGGIYFNMIVAIAAVAIHLVTGWEVILLLAVAQTFAITQQLLPLLRLDGYYILSDLTGVPDLLNRLRPVLRSAVPGREAETKVTELKPWVRRVVTGYTLVLVPLLALMFAVMIVHAPRAFATAYDSFGLQLDRIRAADGAAGIAAGVLQLVMLVLPVAGMVLSTGRVGRRGGSGAWRATEGRPALRGLLVAGAAGAVALAAWTWWPNGDYRPIQPAEKGTLAAGVSDLAAVPSGRPALTAARAEQLGGAPSERDLRAGRATRPASASDDGGGADAQRRSRSERDRGEARDRRGTSTATTTADDEAPGISSTPGSSSSTPTDEDPTAQPAATQPAPAPAQTTPTQTAPADTAPAQTAPTQTTPTQTQPTPTQTTTTSTQTTTTP